MLGEKPPPLQRPSRPPTNHNTNVVQVNLMVPGDRLTWAAISTGGLDFACLCRKAVAGVWLVHARTQSPAPHYVEKRRCSSTHVVFHIELHHLIPGQNSVSQLDHHRRKRCNNSDCGNDTTARCCATEEQLLEATSETVTNGHGRD